MKKRTLNQTWTLCLRMWRWIAKVWQTPRYRRYDVVALKIIWLRKNGFRYIWSDCFFCDCRENETDNDDEGCNEACPGALVDPDFDCMEDAYYYRWKPVEFYKELLRLNRIRKAKK